MDWTETYRYLKKGNWIILLFMTALSGCFLNVGWVLGVLLGGVTSILSFDVLQRNICRAFFSDGEPKVKKAPVIVKLYLRFLALGAAIYLLIRLEGISPVGLALGLSTVALSIVSFGIWNAFKSTTGEAI